MKVLPIIWVILTLSVSFDAMSEEALSDQAIRQILIKQSIASYPGNCPCPYNRASNGSRCGKRSAWSKAGGYTPLCFDSDVSDEAVARYRQKHNKPQSTKK